MDDEMEVVTIYIVFMFMSIIKYHILQRQWYKKAEDVNAVVS